MTKKPFDVSQRLASWQLLSFKWRPVRLEPRINKIIPLVITDFTRIGIYPSAISDDEIDPGNLASSKHEKFV